MIKSKKKINSILIFSFLLFAIFIRFYNIGYDDLWFDEISSYWVSDPKISFEDSFLRHSNIEKTPYFYFSLLKLNFYFFSYDPIAGRLLSLIFNILGIIYSVLICKLLRNNNSYIFALFIFATNIFLINYSQEIRVYSLVFFLSSLYLYLFLKISTLDENVNFNFLYFFLISFTLTLMLISHPFCFIIFFSTSVFLFLKSFFKKKSSKILVYNFYFGFFFSLIYLPLLLENIGSSPSWITQPGLKFYTNFYFSKFFGSRLLGLIHLTLLLSLFLYIFKKNAQNNFNLYILPIIIFFSYFLPLIYGYLFSPIIFPKYIIFVLTPIVVLLSILIFEINNSKLKNIFILLIIILNFGNNFFEASFQQFYKQRPFFKPNFTKMINTIKYDETKLFTIELSALKDNNKYYYEAINNYISNFEIYKNSNVRYVEKEIFLRSSKKKIWVICLINIVSDKCKKIRLNPNDKILAEKKIPGIRMVLISVQS